MNRFCFGLQRLLDMRRRDEELLSQRQTRLEQALADQRDVLAAFDRDRTEHCHSLDALKRDAVSVPEVLHLGHFLVDLESRIARQRARVVDAEQAVREARVELTQARRERKALEKLREKQHAAWQLEAMRADARLMDEIASRRLPKAP